ncbi:hypothetical protein HOY80DRAFT_1136958 [Tuber brumale]|nr:hypothetical protein HOY80DRAFT_1136958 [Tuber brumale]
MASVPEQGAAADTTPSSEIANLDVPYYIDFYLTEGVEGVRHQRYRGPRSFTNTLDQRAKEGQSDGAGYCIVFSPVTEPQLEKLDRIRNTQYNGLRFWYVTQEQALIVKIMPGPTHEIVNRMFAKIIWKKAIQMGFDEELVDAGSTTISAPGGRKEGDSTFRPVEFRPRKNDWPTLVVETGASEPPGHQVSSSQWWFGQSAGEVQIVIHFSVSEPERHIHIEKWEGERVPNPQTTGAEPDTFRITPNKTQEIDIIGNVVTGAPLRLEFAKVMLRNRRNGERDIIFGVQELRQYAATVWGSTQ